MLFYFVGVFITFVVLMSKTDQSLGGSIVLAILWPFTIMVYVFVLAMAVFSGGKGGGGS